MKNLKTIISIFVLGVSMTSIAQNKKFTKGNQQWIQYYNQTKFSDKWTWSTDGGYRFNEMFKNPSQFIVRTGFGYQLNTNMKASIGFAHLGFYTSEKLNKVEYRPYQEFAISNKYNKIGILHRFRIEERFFQNVLDGNIQTAGNFNFRFRYLFMLNLKIMKLSSTNPDRVLSMNLGDEIFINAGKEIVYNVFDQNRILIGPAIEFTKNFTIAITYNSQYAAYNSSNNYNHTDVIWLGIKQNLDITKHKKQPSK